MVADHIDIQRITPVREFLAKYCDPETFAAANGAWGVSMAAAEFHGDIEAGLNAAPQGRIGTLAELERIGALAASLNEALVTMGRESEALLNADTLANDMSPLLRQLALRASSGHRALERRPGALRGPPVQLAERVLESRLATIWKSATGLDPTRGGDTESAYEQFVGRALHAARSSANAIHLVRRGIDSRRYVPVFRWS
jgi:hypothetical protein